MLDFPHEFGVKYKIDGTNVLRVNVSELLKNMSVIVQWLAQGGYVELKKYGRTIGMIVPE